MVYVQLCRSYLLHYQNVKLDIKNRVHEHSLTNYIISSPMSSTTLPLFELPQFGARQSGLMLSTTHNIYLDILFLYANSTFKTVSSGPRLSCVLCKVYSESLWMVQISPLLAFAKSLSLPDINVDLTTLRNYELTNVIHPSKRPGAALWQPWEPASFWRLWPRWRMTSMPQGSLRSWPMSTRPVQLVSLQEWATTVGTHMVWDTHAPVALIGQVAEVSGMYRLPSLAWFRACRPHDQGCACCGRSQRPLGCTTYRCFQEWTQDNVGVSSHNLQGHTQARSKKLSTTVWGQRRSVLGCFWETVTDLRLFC